MYIKQKSAFLSLCLFVATGMMAFAQTPAAPPKNPSSVGDVQFSGAGALSPGAWLLPGVPFPSALSQQAVQAFCQLRDSVYNGTAPETAEEQAVSLQNIVNESTIHPNDRLLLGSRIAYLAGRSWNEHKNKKKAVPWFEQAVAAARELMNIGGETPTALVAYAEPLGELSILKDIAFLVSNGPKVGQSATKALESDPRNVKAWLLKASALAYPPPIWGGNYRKALETYASIMTMSPAGLPSDALFDLRVGIATAYANLKLPDQAAWWFGSALELYPQNIYANSELEKLKK